MDAITYPCNNFVLCKLVKVYTTDYKYQKYSSINHKSKVIIIFLNRVRTNTMLSKKLINQSLIELSGIWYQKKFNSNDISREDDIAEYHPKS